MDGNCDLVDIFVCCRPIGVWQFLLAFVVREKFSQKLFQDKSFLPGTCIYEDEVKTRLCTQFENDSLFA